MKRASFFAISACFAAFCAATVDASLINVDFGTDNTTTYGDTVSAVYSGAAVVGASGDIWNATNALSGSVALVDSAGLASGATMTYSGGNMYSIGGSFESSTYKNLMHDYLIPGWSTTSASTFATLTGLAAGTYKLYIYSASNAKDRQATFYAATSAGSSSATIGPNSSYVGTFTNEEGVTYGVLDVTIRSGDTLTLSAISDTAGVEIDINGFQLQSVPEPASLALLTLGAIGVSIYAWRKHRKSAA
jgi:hypothetical protein